MKSALVVPKALAAAGLLAGLLGGCVAAPPEPLPVVAMPGANKTFAAFQQDDMACRTQASRAVPAAADGASPVPAAAAALPAPPAGATPPPSGAPAAAPPPERVYADCMVAHGNTLQPPPAGPAVAAIPAYAGGYPYPYPAVGYDPFFYGGPGLFWGSPFYYGFYGGFYGRGYYPGRYFGGHPYGFGGGGFRGGGFRSGGYAGISGGFHVGHH